MPTRQDVIHTRIWDELPEEDNPFAARACYCSGYDVYGDLLGNVTWIEYLYLLFRLEPPEAWQAEVLETLAVALANPGPRDPSVRAAMCGGVGQSTYASCLIAALAPAAGQLGGAREVALAMEQWQQLGEDLSAWQATLGSKPAEDEPDIWPMIEHPPGFDPNGSRCSKPVLQTLSHLAQLKDGGPLQWLLQHRTDLEALAGNPLAMSGVAACAFIHLGFEPRQGEMLYLLLRLPGAAAHALEQESYGWRRYPFFVDGLHLAPEADPATSGCSSQ